MVASGDRTWSSRDVSPVPGPLPTGEGYSLSSYPHTRSPDNLPAVASASSTPLHITSLYSASPRSSPHPWSCPTLPSPEFLALALFRAEPSRRCHEMARARRTARTERSEVGDKAMKQPNPLAPAGRKGGLRCSFGFQSVFSVPHRKLWTGGRKAEDGEGTGDSVFASPDWGK